MQIQTMFFRVSRLLLVPLVLAGTFVGATACGNANDRAALAEADPDAIRALPPRGHAWIIFGGDTVVAEVAATPQEREQGLMYRTELGENEGMLFIFERTEPLSFWMRNTFIPLDIAFLDREQRIVDIQQMEPQDEEFTESAAPAMFALEVRQGWFEGRGIDVGAEGRIVLGAR